MIISRLEKVTRTNSPILHPTNNSAFAPLGLLTMMGLSFLSTSLPLLESPVTTNSTNKVTVASVPTAVVATKQDKFGKGVTKGKDV